MLPQFTRVWLWLRGLHAVETALIGLADWLAVEAALLGLVLLQ